MEGARSVVGMLLRSNVFLLPPQVDTPWRKAVTKLEGDPAYEALDKIDRLEVFQEYIKCALLQTSVDHHQQ